MSVPSRDPEGDAMGGPALGGPLAAQALCRPEWRLALGWRTGRWSPRSPRSPVVRVHHPAASGPLQSFPHYWLEPFYSQPFTNYCALGQKC